MVNITDVAEVFGQFFGVGAEFGGIFISVIIVIAVLLAFSLYTQNEMAIAISGVGLFSLFTFLEWFPIWLTIIIVLIVAVLVGRKAGIVFGAKGDV